MAPRVGFEPTAIRLTVECSTAELSGSSPDFAGQAAPIAVAFMALQGASGDKLFCRNTIVESMFRVEQ